MNRIGTRLAMLGMSLCLAVFGMAIGEPLSAALGWLGFGAPLAIVAWFPPSILEGGGKA